MLQVQIATFGYTYHVQRVICQSNVVWRKAAFLAPRSNFGSDFMHIVCCVFHEIKRSYWSHVYSSSWWYNVTFLVECVQYYQFQSELNVVYS